MSRARTGPIARGLLALAVLVVLAAPASAGEVAIVAPRTDGAAGEVAVVGLVVEADADVSALQGGLAYDPAVLEVVDVVAGAALPDGARADFNADERGWLRLGFVCSPSKVAFHGHGEALRVRFRVKGAVGAESPLVPERVRAWQPDDVEHRVAARPGAVKVVAATAVAWLPFAAIGGVLLLLLVLLLARLAQRPKPAPGHGPVGAPPTRSGAGLASPRTGSGRPRFCPACGTAVANAAAKFCVTCGEGL